MKIFSKIQQQYDQLWKYIIRPQRNSYGKSSLGPQTFTLQNIKVKRNSFQLINQNQYKFNGSHYVPVNSDYYPCVIYLHGNSSNQTQGMEYLSQLIKNNISLCTFDFPGCGNADGEYVTLGYRQWKDVEIVVSYLKNQQKVTKIALWGRSMGAVTALRYARQHPQLSAAIYDSPFKSLKSLVDDLAKKNSKLPKIIVAGAFSLISKTIKQKVKFSIYDLNPLQNDSPKINTPGFFIVGKQDQLIPYQHTKLIYQSYKSMNKQIRIVTGLHNTTRPQNCIKDAIKFLNTILFQSEEEQFISNQGKNQIDFFNQSLNKKQSHSSDSNQFDFFQQNSGKQEIQFKEDDQATKESTDMFSFISGLSTVFGGKEKKTKKIIDGYQQLRNQILTIAIQKSNSSVEAMNKQSQKIAKQLKNSDNAFKQMIEANPLQYIW